MAEVRLSSLRDARAAVLALLERPGAGPLTGSWTLPPMNRLRFLAFVGWLTALVMSLSGCGSIVRFDSGHQETGGGGTGGITTTTSSSATGGGNTGGGGTGGAPCDLAACPPATSECAAVLCNPDGTCGEAPKPDGTPCGWGKACSAGSCKEDPIEYIKASNTGTFDGFGSSVALSADGNTLAVGATGEDSNATGINGNQADDSAEASGAVYVFTRSGGAWSQQAYIKASNPGTFDGFGSSVALSADGTTLAVGAKWEESSATGINGNQADNSGWLAGAAYVFTRSGATWSQQAYIKASNSGVHDFFGSSVALSADGTTLAVGATREDSNATGINGNQADNSAWGSGAVYVFTRDGGTWSQQAYVKASNTGSDDHFGSSVALSADGTTLAVGATWEDSNATGINGNQADSAWVSGAVYVFTRDGGTWPQQVYIKASNPGMFDDFGSSVALSADGNTLAVGATMEASGATGINGNQADNSAEGSGAVYVFTRDGGTWSQQAYIKASNSGKYDTFGFAVTISADGATLAVGAYVEDSGATGVSGNQADNSATDSGAVYVFTRSGGAWSQQAYVKASNTGVSDNFGKSVALSAGGTTLAVGANREASGATGVSGNQADNSATDSGAVYVY